MFLEVQRFQELSSTGKVATPKNTDLVVKIYAMPRIRLQMLTDFGETFACGFTVFVKPDLQAPGGFTNIETVTRTFNFIHYSVCEVLWLAVLSLEPVTHT